MNGQPSKTGMWVSAAMHAGLLAFLVFGFAYAPTFDDASETIPVDAVTQTQFNEIMKGERDAKPMKEPPPAPAPKAAAETPPPPPPPPPIKTADAPPPPPPPAVTPPPKIEPPPPAPPPRPTAEDAPAPTPRPKETPPPKPRPDVFKPDALAKLIEKAKDDPPPKPQKSEYDPNAIAKLIGDTKTASADPTPTASTARGLPNQNAQRMSPSVAAALDGWLHDAYLNCWTPPPGMPQGELYVAEVRIVFNPDGSLAGQPELINPPSDPAWKPHAESAVRAVLKCNPLRVPAEFAPYFDQWRTKTVHFDPTAATG